MATSPCGDAGFPSWCSNQRTERMLNRKGFTLIELLIGVGVSGLLIAVATPKFANTKEKAYLATEKSDLRNLITAQESYFADNTAYTTALPATMYATSTGVTGPTITVSGSDV